MIFNDTKTHMTSTTSFLKYCQPSQVLPATKIYLTKYPRLFELNSIT